MRKHLALIFASLGLVAVAAGLTGCSMAADISIPDDAFISGKTQETGHGENNGLINAIATLRRTDGGVMYLRVDTETRAEIANPEIVESIGEGHRVLVQYYKLTVAPSSAFFTCMARINLVSSIVEGYVRAMTGGDLAAGMASSDPIDIVDDWISNAEDGFLTLHYKMMAGGQKAHRFILGYDAANPASLTLMHFADGDSGQTLTEGMICFPLDFLPADFTGEISLVYKPISGGTVTTKYNTGI